MQIQNEIINFKFAHTHIDHPYYIHIKREMVRYPKYYFLINDVEILAGNVLLFYSYKTDFRIYNIPDIDNKRLFLIILQVSGIDFRPLSEKIGIYFKATKRILNVRRYKTDIENGLQQKRLQVLKYISSRKQTYV